MTPDQFEIAIRLGVALLVGGIIGLERELHGRQAGFRTHMLVCLASAILMQVALFPEEWLGSASLEGLRIDPFRMAQGVMTGIGFVGAGEIFRQGWSVRGLTTAASIWITAALGIAAGAGMYYVAAVSTAAIMIVLIVLNWFESRLSVDIHVRHSLRFARSEIMDESILRDLLRGHGFTTKHLSHGLIDSGRLFEYRMELRTRDTSAADRLSHTLRGRPEVVEFDISPWGD